MLVCGIDIGTTNLKASIADLTGRPVWTRAIPTQGGSAAGATDPAVLVDSIEKLIIEGWSAVGRNIPLAAISATGIGEDGLCVDDRLLPLGLAIPWFDRRAIRQAEGIRSSPAATPRAGVSMDHTRTGAKWLWLRQNEPEMMSRARCWLALTDYPSSVWTGRPFISETLASRTGCYDVGKREWLRALLDFCGAPELPPVLRAGEIVGPVVSGPLLDSGAASKETLVVAGGHDHPVAASVIQRVDPAARVDSIGTANVVYGETLSFPLDHFDPFIAFMVPLHAQVGVACLGVFEFSAAVQALQADGVDIRAFLDLPRMPGKPGAPQPLLSTPEPRRSLRSVLESASLTARQMLDHMRAAGVKDGPIYATGGWSRSRSLLELRASIYGMPIRVLSEQEPAVVGAALLAAEGTGRRVDIAGSIRLETVEPDPDWTAFYDDHYHAHFEPKDFPSRA
ncbi:xylulokinase [Sinorhizobium fredii]|uniref:Carbohydrate kinase FGGY n=1 Tax=Sinorhizobium fredii (strain USDA 257) TaxID=1185652 RepID=I3X3L1_SINF2|nr:FGGY family carbohydrate kinase [Sinorhizobium fredii]AFL50467.1 carbohydrate kinase FGGY [Sinorhizobium fredii USDA 257]